MKLHRYALPLPILAAALAMPAQAQEAQEPGLTPNEIVVIAQRINATEVRASGDLGVLGDKDSLDVPFVVRTFDESLILNQQPLTLGEVLENDPSVRTTYAFGNAAEQFVIRGFPLYGDDVGMNGLYGITPRQLVAPELYSGVQVLNGANAFLNGAAPGGTGIGGNVTLQLKRAGERPITRLTASYLSGAHFGGSADVARRFGADGQFGVRINGAYRSGDVAVDDEFRRTIVGGASFDWSTNNLRVTLDGAYQRYEVNRLRPQVVIGNGAIPEVPEADLNYGPAFASTELRDIFGLARIEYDVADNAMLYVTGGALDGNEQGTYAGITVTDAATGAATISPSIIPARINNEAVEAGLRVRLGETITHEFNFGGNMNWQQFRTAYDFRSGYATNLYAPVDAPISGTSTFFSGDLDDPNPSARSIQLSAFASDTIGLWDDRILLTGGLRLQEITQKSYNVANGDLTSRLSSDAVTPVIGLVVKPTERISLFANRIEGLQPGTRAPVSGIDPDNTGAGQLPVTNGGQALAPARSVQYEVGGKIGFDRLQASLALYQIEQPSFYLAADPDVAGSLRFGSYGEQRNRGIELFVTAQPVDGLRLIAGGSVVDAKLRRTPGGANEGNDALGVPDYTLNANVEWDLPFVPGFTLTGRVIHTGEQAANVTNTSYLDDWTTLDLGARYVLATGGVPLTLRFGVDNVTNERFWSSSYSAFASGDTARLLQGRPRTYRGSVTVDF
ncbi:TonB-dependent siderophore receptor [Erythrobacter sp. 3-20A1M]|uniref:TonB-dependent receptor n=1 Tax=Erythrobacter sp. 3-20A1M TaxID=2653850 RepID=UPI001BFC6715|nr:TonB-dependent receptor [Erythrobacter sp. 3-20A1M]QWC57243.1 TonB-dependent siderophore receptor [Erythrobacter sp. 3-20A1M]